MLTDLRSVLGRALQSSPWPTLLQTDTTARHGVRGIVSNGLLLQTAIVVLISAAAIVTPLGLYQVIEPSDSFDLEPFHYAQDNSPFGYGSPARMAGPFSRNCGDSKEPCPGSWKNATCTQKGLAEVCTGVTYDRAIPEILSSTLRDRASTLNGSVSSIFDIQWRTQTNASDAFGALGWYVKSAYRQIGILVLDPTIQLVDGLLVDAQNGGIGFRNHTVPLSVHEYGSTWDEDILFVEPETQCVNLNVTFEFQLTQNSTGRLAPTNLTLRDQGGFSPLSRTSPDLSVPEDGNGQGHLDLRERAYKAAWLNNFLTLAYFNRTGPDPTNITRLDITLGMAFTSNASNASTNRTTTVNSFKIEYQAIRSSLDFGQYLDLPGTRQAVARRTRATRSGSVSHTSMASVSKKAPVTRKFIVISDSGSRNMRWWESVQPCKHQQQPRWVWPCLWCRPSHRWRAGAGP